MEWDGSPGVPGVGGAGSPRGTVTWRVWKVGTIQRLWAGKSIEDSRNQLSHYWRREVQV